MNPSIAPKVASLRIDAGAEALVAIVGPTGSGKSELALAMAERHAAEIVNFDSVQVYRGFDIGSAKTPEGGRRGIPHHLLDIVDGWDEMNAGRFFHWGRAALQEIRSRQKLPLLVGGTGFYLRALIDGLSPAPVRSEELRKRLAASRSLFRFLRRYDPLAAARIHPNDRQKLIRAVEMAMLARERTSAIQARSRPRLEEFRTLKLGLNPERGLLRDRIEQRTRWMFAHGLVEETERLLAAGVPANGKAMQSLGYRQAVAVLNGKLTVEGAMEECTAGTRQYAKRQMTWFRADPEVIWMEGFGSEAAVQRNAEALLLHWSSQQLQLHPAG